MAFNRRDFVRKMGAYVGATALSTLINPAIAKNIEQAVKGVAHLSPEEIAKDEAFWFQIRQAYAVSPNIINLNNGGVSPQPKVVQEAVEHYNRWSNEAPTYYMWQMLDRGRPTVRRNLARIAGCDAGEIAIQRNSTEALDNIIFGLRLKAGDEVVLAKQDYPNMINAWKQRAKRDGIVLKWINLELPIENKEQIVQQYAQAFTEKTKLVQITHVINWIGQIMPVAEIATVARARGIEVMVDAAHSFAQLDFKIPDLKCDYLGTSLHKWLCAPFGTGMLYVRKEKIKNLYPLFAAPDPEDESIRKFENMGTRSIAIEQAIGQAIIFHEMIGIERKQARLQYLKNYWATRASKIPRVSIHTSLDPRFGCAIGLFSIKDQDPVLIARELHLVFRLHTVGINWENIRGVRITPHVYTLITELDLLLEGIEHYCKKG